MERKLFELTPVERKDLQGFIDLPSKRAVRIARLDEVIRVITVRVAPFFIEGQGMVHNDLRLIETATEVVSATEDELLLSHSRLNRARRNLYYLFTGTGMPE
jgi:hypothetical protein